MGRVEDVISDQDGIITVAMVRTAAGFAKRAVAKLAVLPFETELGEIPSNRGRMLGAEPKIHCLNVIAIG